MANNDPLPYATSQIGQLPPSGDPRAKINYYLRVIKEVLLNLSPTSLTLPGAASAVARRIYVLNNELFFRGGNNIQQKVLTLADIGESANTVAAGDDERFENRASLQNDNEFVGAQTFQKSARRHWATIAQFGGNINNLALNSAPVWRLSSDATRNLTGIVAGADGLEIEVHNVGGFPIVFKHDTASTAANRFALPNSMDFALLPNSAVSLRYDLTSARWRVCAKNSELTWFFPNTSAPSASPVDGVYVYAEGGALKAMGSSGTVTTVAVS